MIDMRRQADVRCALRSDRPRSIRTDARNVSTLGPNFESVRDEVGSRFFALPDESADAHSRQVPCPRVGVDILDRSPGPRSLFRIIETMSRRAVDMASGGCARTNG